MIRAYQINGKKFRIIVKNSKICFFSRMFDENKRGGTMERGEMPN
jgi:hypothetical protein